MAAWYFITGASSGIGEAIAREVLNRPKSHVWGISRSQHIHHARFTQQHVDLINSEELEQVKFPSIEDNVDRVVLINNAGMLGDIRRVGTADEQVISNLIYLNATVPAVLMNRFIGTYGHEKNVEVIILNVSSGAGSYPIDAWASYCGSKAFVDHFSKTVAEEQRITSGNVVILSVGPGVVDTPMQTQIRTSDTAQFSRAQHFKDLHTNGELQSPTEVAQKYLHVIDHPELFPNTVGSLRDLV